ncbi:hypothetical protein [Endozoicomonas arenosclerae]|uniref:hypothetical protein n=1 Tax=Endozoicomonas arenosclerae TaxID=1633495 RepID=UPI000782FC55|nr:hypothetical protein [Endozoicomonas arenosclerae]
MRGKSVPSYKRLIGTILMVGALTVSGISQQAFALGESLPMGNILQGFQADIMARGLLKPNDPLSVLNLKLPRSADSIPYLGPFDPEKLNVDKIPASDPIHQYINSPTERAKVEQWYRDNVRFMEEEVARMAAQIKFKHQLETLYPYAFASYLSYRYKAHSDSAGVKEALEDRLTQIHYRNAEKEDVPEKWLQQGLFETKNEANRVYDKKDSGLKARVFIHTSQKKILIAFTGTEFDNANSMMNAAWTHGGYGYGYLAQATSYLTGFITGRDYSPYEVPMLRKALELTIDLYDEYKDRQYDIELTGTSLGGAIAQYVSFKTRLKAVVFNSLALNSAIYWQVQNEEPDLKPEELITHAYLEGELLNDTTQGYFIQGPFHYLYAQGSMPVEGLEIPAPASEKSLHGIGQFWSRHAATGLLNAIEAHMKLDLPPLKPKKQEG